MEADKKRGLSATSSCALPSALSENDAPESNKRLKVTATSAAAATITTPGGMCLDRTQLLRVLGATLNELDLVDSAAALQLESGIAVEAESVRELRAAVLAGEWECASAHLAELPVDSCADASWHDRIADLLFERRVVDFLCTGRAVNAIACLRDRVLQRGSAAHRLGRLATAVLFTAADSVLRWAAIDVAADTNDTGHFWRCIRVLLPAQYVLPMHRLLALIEQALVEQTRACVHHNHSLSAHAAWSLVHNHVCPSTTLPRRCIHTATQHRPDQVWSLAFSHNGLLLASTSSCATNSLVLWSVAADFSLFVAHRASTRHVGGAQASCAWSACNAFVLTHGVGVGAMASIWCASSGALLHSFDGGGVAGGGRGGGAADGVLCACWLPAPEGELCVVAATLARELCVWTLVLLDGGGIGGLRLSRRVTCSDLGIVTAMATVRRDDGSPCVAACAECRVRIYNVADWTFVSSADVSALVATASSDNSRHVLMCTNDPPQMHVMDMHSLSVTIIGHMRQSRFVMRAAIGGGGGGGGGSSENILLACGGGVDDAQVCIFGRSGALLTTLTGHTHHVNDVCWHPTAAVAVLASAADDGSIRVWRAAH